MGCRPVERELLTHPPMSRPKRLDGVSYVGLSSYFVTSCTLDRRQAFGRSDFCEECLREQSATSRRFGFAVIAYCFMPDHVHQLVEAASDVASLPEFVSMWKQRTGFAWRRRVGTALWQKGYWERILRSSDSMLPIARYVVENPVRAGLVTDIHDYPWVGSDRYALDDILVACQMDLQSGWHR